MVVIFYLLLLLLPLLALPRLQQKHCCSSSNQRYRYHNQKHPHLKHVLQSQHSEQQLKLSRFPFSSFALFLWSLRVLTFPSLCFTKSLSAVTTSTGHSLPWLSCPPNWPCLLLVSRFLPSYSSSVNIYGANSTLIFTLLVLFLFLLLFYTFIVLPEIDICTTRLTTGQPRFVPCPLSYISPFLLFPLVQSFPCYSPTSTFTVPT